METIKFKKELLGFYTLITKPGRYELTVTNNVNEDNLVGEEGENKRYIVNLKAIAADKIEQLKQVFTGKDEVSIDETNGLFMTANIWKREGKASDLPMKGEVVDVIVDYVTSREEQQVLRITSVKRKSAAVATKLDLTSIFADTAIPAVPAPAESVLTHS